MRAVRVIAAAFGFLAIVIVASAAAYIAYVVRLWSKAMRSEEFQLDVTPR